MPKKEEESTYFLDNISKIGNQIIVISQYRKYQAHLSVWVQWTMKLSSNYINPYSGSSIYSNFIWESLSEYKNSCVKAIWEMVFL